TALAVNPQAPAGIKQQGCMAGNISWQMHRAGFSEAGFWGACVDLFACQVCMLPGASSLSPNRALPDSLQFMHRLCLPPAALSRRMLTVFELRGGQAARSARSKWIGFMTTACSELPLWSAPDTKACARELEHVPA